MIRENKGKRNKKFRINTDTPSIVLFVMLLSWMALIFFMSSQSGDDSSLLSGYLSDSLVKFADTIYNGNTPEALLQAIRSGLLLRKAGHVFEYIVMGVLAYLLIRRQNVKRPVLISILFCAIYAATDELHQMFVPDRGPAIADVLLDSVSSAAAVLVLWLSVDKNGRRCRFLS